MWFQPAIPGPTIRACRRAVGMTQRELAAQLGYSQAWVGHIERGKRGCSRADTARLVQVLVAAYEQRQAERRELAELGLGGARLPVER